MKLSFQNNVLGLSAETEVEREICALLMAADRYIFQLHSASDRGFSLAELGPEDDALRAPLNITHAAPVQFQPISNLALTPFEIEGQHYASIEGFWQGLKFAEPVERRRVAKLSGPAAREAGKAAGQPVSFEVAGQSVVAGSPEHWQLMRQACAAKFAQHAGARSALLATGQRWLTHRVRRDSRTIPGAIMAQIWMDLRGKLRGEETD